MGVNKIIDPGCNVIGALEKLGGGREGVEIVILPHSLLHKSLTTKQAPSPTPTQKKDKRKQHSKQAIRQEKLRKITKC